MNKKSSKTYSIAAAGIVGGVYAALTLLLAPISYGPLQMRVSEVLCIMPYFIPSTAWGLFFGCAAANILTANAFDVIFGSLATLGAALVTARLGKREHSMKNALLACSMPVIFNGLVVGAVITFAYQGMSFAEDFEVFLVNASCVALGEALVMAALGLPLIRSLPREKFFKEYLEKINK